MGSERTLKVCLAPCFAHFVMSTWTHYQIYFNVIYSEQNEEQMLRAETMSLLMIFTAVIYENKKK